MKMTPKIETSTEKKLVGKSMTMSYADYKIGQLWGSFMPRRKEITNSVTNDLISMVVYPPTHFTNFKPTNEFERWAAVEVTNLDSVPEGMETFTLPSGLYAVFLYKGTSTDISNFYQHIFTVWIPNSDYVLDNRPHFEILGEKYKNNDPSSEEEIWIPIKMK
jgi:AraC family transcriptional regulator